MVSCAALLVAAGVRAAERARYRVTFDATWDPAEVPPNPHFSPLIGASHDAMVTFWQTGSPASPGIEAMAELGATTPLDQEIGAAITAGTAMELISGFGVSVSPGSTFRRFFAYDTHSLVTLVTMIAPSPDWFLGVSRLELRPGGQWVDDLVVSLSPYDAGTDDGVTFLSPDADTQPPEMIAPITGFPFEGAPPLGTFSFELLSVTQVPGVPALAPGATWASAALLALAATALRASRRG